MKYDLLECLVFTFLLGTRFPENYAQMENTTRPEVWIHQGTLQGITLETRNGRNVSAFLGIPFAQPPIGNLRFANPVAAGGWDETLDASTDSSRCPQISRDTVHGEEDCLYINVYTPEITNSSLLPVMVYIHGGAFSMGSQASTSYGPTYLLDEDVVLVAANYRLGLLGFLSTGDEIASGNWGLKDQVLALKWVQENIRYFGGDPDQVTIFGESAGSVSVHLLTLSNATIGLFHRYITQSGSALATWAYRPRVAYSNVAFKFGTFAGCSNHTSDSLISCLRAIDFVDILTNDEQFGVSINSLSIIWGPTDEPDIEGAILTDSPSNLFAAGQIRDLPWISGVVRDEGLLKTAAFYENEKSFGDFLENFDFLLPHLLGWTYLPDSGAAWVKATKSYYFNDDLTMNTSLLLTNLTALCGDAQFYYPARNALEQHHALAENPQYFYTFNYRGTYTFAPSFGGSAEGHGVAHADDLIYLFRNEALARDGNFSLSESDHEVVDTMVKLWTSFAINGTPTALPLNGVITWTPYSSDDDYLKIGNESDVTSVMQYSFFPDRMQFWASIDGIVETEETADDDSGTVTLSPNLLLLLVIVCAKFIPSE